jgi:plastocyanin
MFRLALLGFASLLLAGTGPPANELYGTTHAGEKPIRDAVVWLDGSAGALPMRRAKVTLDQRNLSFSPHVLAVQLGTKVYFPNHDRVFHSVFSFHDGKQFDLGLYPVGAVKEVPFDQSGLSRVFCNIHPQMAAYVMVVDTPYFAVSDDSGRFSIRDVLSGTYRYHAWHAGAPILSDPVIVVPGTALEIRWR